MTASLPGQVSGWTIDDLMAAPDDGKRYELVDGSLLVSPPPTVPHGYSNTELDRILHRACPPDLYVTSVGLGVDMGGRKTYYVPDITVVTVAAMRRRDATVLGPADVRLAVEVLSRGNARADLVLKRHDYGAAGIPHYWIVDPVARTLQAHCEPFRDGYRFESTVKAGEQWTTSEPFVVTLDPADFT